MRSGFAVGWITRLRTALWHERTALAMVRPLGLHGALVVRRHLYQRGSPIADPGVDTVTLPVPGHPQVRLRRGSSDARVLADCIGPKYHRPPPDVTDPRVIVDLGTNLGLTTLDFALCYPRARVIGVEPQREYFEHSRRLTQPVRPRVTMVHAGIWTSDGRLALEVEAGSEYGARLAPGSALPRDGGVRVVSLNTLLADLPRVDFLKVDIEGAEQALFRTSTEWARKVRVLKVEVHAPYSVEECVADLQRLGYSCVRDSAHPGALLARRR